MKKLLLIAVNALLIAFSANAAEQVTALSPSDSEYIDVYESYKSVAPMKQVSRDELDFPLTIQDTQNGYLKVAIGSHAYWVKAAKVRIRRDVTASCGAALSAERVGSTPGLSGNTCK